MSLQGESESKADRFICNLLLPPVPRDFTVRIGDELSRVLDDPAMPTDTKRHAAYYMAQVHEYHGDWDRMAQMLDFSGVPVGRDHDDYDFLRHQGWAHVFRQQQAQAIDRGIPPIYINSSPQSGSSFLTAFLTTALGIERCRTTKGPYMTSRIVPAWLTTFSEGGATTHEHFCASPNNISVLEASGISKLVIHVRHPIAAMLSNYRRFLKSDEDDQTSFFLNRFGFSYTAADLRDPKLGLSIFSNVFLPYRVRFFESWMDYSLQPARKIKILFSRYEEQVADPSRFYRQLISFFLDDASTIDFEGVIAKLQAEATLTRAHNYRGGQSNAPVEQHGAHIQGLFASLCKPELLKFYGY